MGWTSNLSGQPERDPHGLYATAREAVENRFRSGQVSTNLQIFTYDPESALVLAPSDRVKVIRLMTGMVIPADKSWEFLRLCVIDLESCKRMGIWSLENWIELLVSIPTAASYRELHAIRERFSGEPDPIFAHTLLLFYHSYLNSSVSEYDTVTAIAEYDPANAEKYRSYSYQAKSPSIMRSLVVGCEDSPDKMDRIVQEAFFENFKECYGGSPLKIGLLFQATIDVGSDSLKRYIVNKMTQNWVFQETLQNGRLESATSRILRWICGHLDLYPEDRLYFASENDDEPFVDWTDEPGPLTDLFGKGLISRYRAARSSGDEEAVVALRERIVNVLDLFIPTDLCDEMISLFPDETPSRANIITMLSHDAHFPFMRRAPVDDIVAALLAISELVPAGSLRQTKRFRWGEVFKDFSKEEIHHIRTVTAPALRDRAVLPSAPWLGRIAE